MFNRIYESQSLNSDQGSSDRLLGLHGRVYMQHHKSQSLNTDQGSSDSTPSKALRRRGLRGLFFQPPPKPAFLWGRAAELRRFGFRKSLQDKGLAHISNRCAKMAIQRWHDP